MSHEPSAKPKLSHEERRVRRLRLVRLQFAIGRELEDRGITLATAVGEALGLPAHDAMTLLARRQWREGDLALLEAAAARLGVRVPD
ncbi:hypothetical protein [Roseomonas chloroacetimidivorans]|uniref:hypothetical protein n=1 Tax=Roseomonas chloroacetimidivorans TaxID=1766656 RepID=UPI003C7078DA